MPKVFEKGNKKVEKMKAEYEQTIESLYAEVGRLTTQLSWLKKNLELRSRAERVEMVDWDDEAKLPISIQADLLSLNRSSLYYKPVGPSPEELFIKHRIDEIYTKHPYYGLQAHCCFTE